MLVKREGIHNWVIYKLTSPSGRVYVGKTYNIEKRINHYRLALCKSQTMLYNSIKKYGYEAHKFDMIETLNCTQGYVSDKEMFWIRSNMSNFSKWPEMRGMNLTDGGEGGIGRKVSDEQRKAHSEYMKANPPKRGYYKHTEETLEKMRVRRKALFLSGWVHPMQGTKRSPETLKKMSDSHKGQVGWLKGKKMSDEHRLLLSKAALNRKPREKYKISEQGRLNIKKAQTEKRGKPVLQCDLSGRFIKEFPSIGLASRELNIPMSTINNLLNRTKNPQGEFTFRYKSVLSFGKIAFQRRVFKLQDIKEKIA